MKHRLILAPLILSLTFAASGSALAMTCPTLHQFQNGQTADASQVMDNFNHILGCPTFTDKVGIGTTVLSFPLSVYGNATGNMVHVENTQANGNAALELFTNGGAGQAYVSQVGGSWGGLTAPLVLESNGPVSVASPVNVPRLTVATNGYVGIGTVVPNTPLSVSFASGTSNIGHFENTQPSGNTALEFFANGGNAQAYVGQIGGNWGNLVAPAILESTGPVSLASPLNIVRLTVLTNGNVGIGTTTPGAMLDVAGVINTSANFSQSSDARLKTDIVPLAAGALDRVMRLKPVTFRWKDPVGDGMRGEQTGLIAQDTEVALPGAVLTAKDKRGTKSIKYNEVTATLIKAVQEQQGLIQRQMEEIQALKTRLAQLEGKGKK
ncbi:tail fiber domain-containing protein [Nitrospirillum sp. BR 11163]|uniref:tail fiber domain-containing protein n=1 Tax=Nitrospirillum sp. BR 11163 TaxID=3104323 RepID=UPI002AFDE220|nr:tail fiber domain-containing protein [Nitrospirillum sp. BR 11163]MEA1677456.1 tail fiber domain-containing protein [Nitrospirillum sp. BR 11163]